MPRCFCLVLSLVIFLLTVFYFTNFNKISLNWFAIKLETLVKHFELSACKYGKISAHKKKDKIKEIKVE
jgi:hypothetical protein